MAFFTRRNDDLREGSSAALAPTGVIPSNVAEVDGEDTQDTLLGAGSRVSGRLFFDGNVRVSGLVEGEICVTGALVVEPSGEIKANIDAGTVVVQGRVLADVTAREILEISEGGTVLGNVSAARLIVCEGGTLDGHCAMTVAPKASAEAA
jgi:cytoskeletal protein CcmA (bactofilin family)